MKLAVFAVCMLAASFELARFAFLVARGNDGGGTFWLLGGGIYALAFAGFVALDRGR